MLIELPQNIEKQVNMMAELQGKTSEQIVIELLEKELNQSVESTFANLGCVAEHTEEEQ